MEDRHFYPANRRLAAAGVQPHAARRRGARLVGCAALAATRTHPRGPGKAGRRLDGPAFDGPADRTDHLRGRPKVQRGLWSGRHLALWSEYHADLRCFWESRAADLAVHPG